MLLTWRGGEEETGADFLVQAFHHCLGWEGEDRQIHRHGV